MEFKDEEGGKDEAGGAADGDDGPSGYAPPGPIIDPKSIPGESSGVVPEIRGTYKESDGVMRFSRWLSWFLDDETVMGKDLEQIVSAIVAEIENNWFSDLGVLTFRTHGSNGSITLGYKDGKPVVLNRGMIDPESDSYDPDVVRELERLRPLFSKNGACVLWSCNTGKDERFLQLLADILGVPVYGLTSNTGDYFMDQEGHWNMRRPGDPLPAPTDPSDTGPKKN